MYVVMQVLQFSRIFAHKESRNKVETITHVVSSQKHTHKNCTKKRTWKGREKYI